MQQLIQELKNSKERGETVVDYDLFCEEFLEKEKDNIENAYIQGFCDCDKTGIMDVEKYYKQTFKNK